MGCERCRRRDELDYWNLDDREKYFLIFMVDGCDHEMIVPDEFVRRFRGEIPGEIKLETRNGQSCSVGVAKYPDKIVLRAGWGAFVKTYDLQIDDSVVFRYKGNSQFDVIVFDQFGREKASSVVADNAPPSPLVQERHRGATENLDRSHGHAQPMEMQSPTEHVNHSQVHPQPMQMQSPTENINCSQGHPQAMQMQSPTENVGHFVDFSQSLKMQSPMGNVDHFLCHSQPMQMQPPIETVNHSNCHPPTVQMQLSHRRTERQSKLQRDYSSRGNKSRATSSSGDSLSSEDDVEVCDAPRYELGWMSHLNQVQKKALEEKVQSIHSDNPIFVAVMSKCNVTGAFTLSISKQYVKRYVGDKERSICLQRLGKRWEVYFGGRPEEKRIVAGWRKFVKDNDVEMGDICIFELLKNYKMCTMEVHIIHTKDLDMSTQIGCEKVQGRRKNATKTAEHSHCRSHLGRMQLPTETVEHSHVHPQPMQIQSPSMERQITLERDNSTQGNKRDSLSSEDSDHEVDTFPGYITARASRLTPIQKKTVEQQVQFVNSEIPMFVVVMHKTNVTGRFTLSISKKYAEKYLGDEVRSIWLQRLGERCQVRLGRRPQDKRIVGGWSKFVKDNEVEMGDICLFELLKHWK